MNWTDFLLILHGLHWTVLLTAGALAIGAILGFPIMLMRVSRNRVLRIVALAFISFVRAIPPIVWIFLIFFGVGAGGTGFNPFAAALVAFGLIAAANMAEIYRGGLIAVPSGQSEAAEALNLSPQHRFFGVIFPQLMRVALPTTATYAIGLLKDSAIASTIGVTELAFQGRYVTQMNYQYLPVLGMVGLIYILLSLPIAWVSRVADQKLRSKVAR
ncbi:amino acid ABC transporter permease [Martelella mediterranea]|uniref:Amino acid ABC transporter membrane protein 1 (PAAT family) n=1 Tax=Martelella mediterranea TaxID=293089 RepID=A0A4R3NC33_9HYPH|nr:amino acid ABC transporter permease [Martelella mediterranea]TCT27707.1 amino acid ABC transporter membrane protein 1 (PAAT family) [Martelella mediterranea]